MSGARRVAAGVLAVGAVWGGLGAVRVNLVSPSAPAGVWVRVPGEAVRGDWVAVCLPAAVAELGRLRGYHPVGSPVWRCWDGSLPVLKRVAAAGGDRVEVTADGVWVEGRLLRGSAPLEVDGRGRPLPRVAAGKRRLGQGEVWLLSRHIPNSWDSRYYGAVDRGCVIGRMRLVLPL